jgi:hypothetical protein
LAEFTWALEGGAWVLNVDSRKKEFGRVIREPHGFESLACGAARGRDH